MTEKKKRFLSLSVKPLFVLLLGLVLLGVGAALLAESVGEAVIERCYLSEAAVLKRTNRAAQELQGYVRQNALTTRNTNALAQWGESRKDYYILLYRDQRQILEIGWGGRRLFPEGAGGRGRLPDRLPRRDGLRRDL